MILQKKGTRLLAPLMALALAACITSGPRQPNVSYSKVRTQPIAVALTVDVAEGKQGKEWRKAMREIGTLLSGYLTGTQMFQDVRNPGDDADYQLNVVVADIQAGQEQLGSVPAYGSAVATGTKLTDAINARQKAYEVRGVKVRVTLLDAEGKEEITAFTTTAAGANTDVTVADVVERISNGLRCDEQGCA